MADETDLTALARLRRTWNEENAGGPLEDTGFETVFASWLDAEHDTRTFFVVEVDGDVVGMANVKRYDRMPAAGRSGGCWGYVGNVFVLPQHRNAGVGQMLMEEIAAWAWSCGMDHLRLAPSPESKTFYDRLGFTSGSVVELNPPGT
jgi:GNAT superfamily N-acetyltransferase